MSVMMLSQEHTNVMVWAATHFTDGYVFEYRNALGHWEVTTRERNRDELGQTLVDTNAGAYLVCNASAEPTYYEYTYSQPVRTDWEVLDVLKAVGCYEYQACEAPDWEGSDAQRICQKLTKALILRLPGFDDSPWGIESDSVPATAL